MAERRMFAKTIIDSDAFLDMPLSTQALYFHLSMRADDDGFINNPLKIMRVVNASKNDLDLLIAKRFVIGFESGVIVIKHWRLHNYIRKDRYNATFYQEEKALLDQNDDGTYTIGQPNDNQRLPQVRLGKVSIGKDSKGNIEDTCGADKSASTPKIKIILNDKSFYPVYQTDVNKWAELYPAVDVMQELRKMAGWCDANPSRRKTKRGVKQFIVGWLAREQDKGRSKKRSDNAPPPSNIDTGEYL